MIELEYENKLKEERQQNRQALEKIQEYED